MSDVETLKAIFPSWQEDDLALVLAESKGSIDEAATKISEGKSDRPVISSGSGFVC